MEPGTTRRVPREVFEHEERARLLPARDAPFDVPRWADPKVHPDHHVQVARSLYSVPTRFIGKNLRARIGKKTVRLYLHNELIEVHPRVAPGKRSTDLSDYPVGKAPYASRVPDVRRIERMLKRAQKAEEEAPAGRVVALPRSRFARDPQSFATISPRAPKGGEWWQPERWAPSSNKR